MVSHSGRCRANQLDTVILRSVEAYLTRIASNWETPNILRPKGVFQPLKRSKSALNLLPKKTHSGRNLVDYASQTPTRVHSASMAELRQTVQLDLRYSEWASRMLLAACSELPVADRNRDLLLSHGSVLGTLHHAYVSEQFWTQCLLATKIPPLDQIGAAPTPAALQLEDLEQSWPEVWSGLQRWLESTSDSELAQPLLCRISADNEFPYIRWQLVRHFVNHSTLHRGQVVGMIRRLGKRPPNVDLMTYLLKHRASHGRQTAAGS